MKTLYDYLHRSAAGNIPEWAGCSRCRKQNPPVYSLLLKVEEPGIPLAPDGMHPGGTGICASCADELSVWLAHKEDASE